VLVVEVPLRVLLDGRPVRGLTADDFEVRDEGRVRPLVSFDRWEIDPAVEGSPGSPVADRPARAAHPRSLLFVFDFAWGAEGLIETRRRLLESTEAVRGLLSGPRLSPGDRLSVAYYSPLRGLKRMVDFTADRDRVRRALDVLDLVIESKSKRIAAEPDDSWQPADHSLRWRDKTPKGQLDATLEDLIAEARLSANRGAEDQSHNLLIKHFTWELRGLVNAIDPPGDRHLVLMSSGLLYGDDQDRSLRFLQELLRELRQHNWSVQAVNIGGLGFGRDSLVLLSRETGGELYTNSRDIGRLLGEMAERTAVTYVLSFQIDNPVADGAYHELEVRLTRGPSGARLVHRTGYYAPGRPADYLPPEQTEPEG
jgi:VWFA-related protein